MSSGINKKGDKHVLVLLIVVGVVAFFRGWFDFSTSNQDDQTAITVNVDKTKVERDLDNARKVVSEPVDGGQKVGHFRGVSAAQTWVPSGRLLQRSKRGGSAPQDYARLFGR